MKKSYDNYFKKVDEIANYFSEEQAEKIIKTEKNKIYNMLGNTLIKLMKEYKEITAETILFKLYEIMSKLEEQESSRASSEEFINSLPTNALRANKIYTGTWNEDLTYSVWYKTNLSDDYIMLKDGLSTLVNNEVKFTDATLQEGEFITDFEFRFGTVKADFREIEQPRLYCDMLDNLPNGFIFVNHTKVSGNYKDIYVEDKDDWTTITYYKEIETTQKLPRTGC